MHRPNFQVCVLLTLTASFLTILTTGCGDSDRSAANAVQFVPPTVLSVAPTSGATGACSNTIVTATFSKAMNPATLNSMTFTVAGPAATNAAGQVTYIPASNTAVFTPSSALLLSTVYKATITTAVADAYGNHLAANFTWTFTTGVAVCVGVGAPTVISVSPPNAAVGTCPNTVITATFSEAMNPVSIDSTTFTLTAPGNTPVAGQITYDAASDSAIFTPSASLTVNALYNATITTGVQDLLGKNLATNFVWSFTTGATLCQPPLPPVSVTPPNGSTGVCTSTVVAVTFPQAMNPATINLATFTVSPGVTGTITHDAADKIFTFTPSANLALSTVYTATINTGARDQAGRALTSNFAWTFTTGAIACAAAPPPAVISESPAAGAVGVCQNSVITATFNEAMNPTTLNTTTFTIGPAIMGVVTLDGTGRVAQFTPGANLALNTTYTATITTGAQDLAGNPLTANFVWTFHTVLLACQPPVNLGSAANFDALASSTITNTGPTIVTGGDLGLSPGSAVTGFPPGTLTPPAMFHVTDPTAAQAQLDLTTAYIYTAGLAGGAVLPGDMSGLTFAPGLYTNATTVMLSAGNVTLDAQGNANAVFIFQVGSTLTTLGSTQVVLAGGAQAKNVFWQVGSSATLGTNSIFKGTIMALQSVTLDTGANMVGRALARNGGVTLDTNMITIP
jgi:hypothetical protein